MRLCYLRKLLKSFQFITNVLDQDSWKKIFNFSHTKIFQHKSYINSKNKFFSLENFQFLHLILFFFHNSFFLFEILLLKIVKLVMTHNKPELILNYLYLLILWEWMKRCTHTHSHKLLFIIKFTWTFYCYIDWSWVCLKFLFLFNCIGEKKKSNFK